MACSWWVTSARSASAACIAWPSLAGLTTVTPEACPTLSAARPPASHESDHVQCVPVGLSGKGYSETPDMTTAECPGRPLASEWSEVTTCATLGGPGPPA